VFVVLNEPFFVLFGLGGLRGEKRTLRRTEARRQNLMR
jgi:hypothetical protein